MTRPRLSANRFGQTLGETFTIRPHARVCVCTGFLRRVYRSVGPRCVVRRRHGATARTGRGHRLVANSTTRRLPPTAPPPAGPPPTPHHHHHLRGLTRIKGRAGRAASSRFPSNRGAVRSSVFHSSSSCSLFHSTSPLPTLGPLPPHTPDMLRPTMRLALVAWLVFVNVASVQPKGIVT